MLSPRVRNSSVMCAAVLAAACGRTPQPIAAEPGVSFAAHPTREVFVIDRLPGGATGLLEPPGWMPKPGTPDLRLTSRGEVAAGLWVYGQSRVLVRREPSPVAPLLGDVVADWTENAIRLTVQVGDGPRLVTDTFAREGGGTGPARLSRAAQTVLDMRGTFRAPLRDGAGREVGWLRVRIGPYQGPPRKYDAVLPDTMDGALAAAAAVLLDAELDWIESHALNVYRSTGEGPLERSLEW